MKRVTMLDDYQGAKKGDVVGFEDESEADMLIEAGKAEPYEPKKPVEGEAQVITPADVGPLKV